MKCGIEKYMHQMDKFDMSEKQKIEYIENLWNIMESFVDRAFGTGPDQLATRERDLDRSRDNQS